MRAYRFQILISISIAALTMLAPAAYSQKNDDPVLKFTEGSRWVGLMKYHANAGFESSSDLEIIVTKREGDTFEAHWFGKEKKFQALIRGKLTGNKVTFRPTKILKQEKDPAKERALRNFIGLPFSGKIGRSPKTKKTYIEAEFHWPDADHPRIVRNGVISVALDE